MSDNPILDAYLANVDREHQQQQQEFENDQAQKMLDMHMKAADETAKYHQADLNIRKVLLKQQLQQHFDAAMGNRQYAGDLPTPSAQPGAQGGDVSLPGQDILPTPSYAQGQPASGGSSFYSPSAPSSLPGSSLPQLPAGAPNSNAPFKVPANATGMDSDVSSLFPGGFTVDPQSQQRDLQGQLVQGAVTAQTEGEKQAAIEQEKQKTALAEQAQKHIDKIAEMVRKNEFDQQLMNVHMGALTSMNNATNNSRIAAAQIKAAAAAQGQQIDPDEVKRQGDAIMYGQENFSNLTSKQKPVIESYIHAAGGIIPDPAAIKALPNIVSLEAFLNRVQTEAPQYSDSTLSNLNPFSKTRNFMNELQSESGRLATTFDQQNRKSDQEIARQLRGLFNPNMSLAENMKNLQRKRSTLNALVQGEFHGMPNDQMNNLLSRNGITQFGGYGAGNDNPLTYVIKGGTVVPVHPSQLNDFLAAHPEAKLQQ